MRHHAKVVGNHDQRQPVTVAQVQQQTQNLRLHGHVQRGGRFVGDQYLRATAQGDGNHCPLAHAAGKLMGKVIHTRSRIRNADLTQQVNRLRPRFTFR